MNFIGCMRLDDQGMNIGLHQTPKSPINHLVPLDLGFASEKRAYDHNGIMTAPVLC